MCLRALTGKIIKAYKNKIYFLPTALLTATIKNSQFFRGEKMIRKTLMEQLGDVYTKRNGREEYVVCCPSCGEESAAVVTHLIRPGEESLHHWQFACQQCGFSKNGYFDAISGIVASAGVYLILVIFCAAAFVFNVYTETEMNVLIFAAFVILSLFLGGLLHLFFIGQMIQQNLYRIGKQNA
jgi:hypothetical protein